MGVVESAPTQMNTNELPLHSEVFPTEEQFVPKSEEEEAAEKVKMSPTKPKKQKWTGNKYNVK